MIMSYRFDNFRQIQAKFPSTGVCGHEIKKGDTIGWYKRHGVSQAYCAECWTKWVAENRAAEAYERTGSDCAYDC